MIMRSEKGEPRVLYTPFYTHVILITSTCAWLCTDLLESKRHCTSVSVRIYRPCFLNMVKMNSTYSGLTASIPNSRGSHAISLHCCGLCWAEAYGTNFKKQGAWRWAAVTLRQPRKVRGPVNTDSAESLLMNERHMLCMNLYDSM